MGTLLRILEKTADMRASVPVVSKLIATTVINIAHAYFIAMIISSLATEITSYSILAVDFMITLYSAYRIIRLQGKVSQVDLTEFSCLT